MIRISLLAPSYKRPDKAYTTFKEWSDSADNPKELEFIMGLDATDSSIPLYYKKFSNASELEKVGRFEISVGQTNTGIQACNRIAKIISPTSELILVVADDQSCIPSWDTVLFAILKGVDNFREPKYIAVSDGIWNKNANEPLVFSPYYFANRAFYSKVGYILSEEYVSMYADNDMFEIAKVLNAIIDARQFFFEHKHWDTHGFEADETYKRRNAQEQFDAGLKTFLERKSRNFDLEVLHD